AVKVVRRIVDREFVLFAVQGEPALGDPVAVPADDGAEVWVVARDVVLEVVEAERDVLQLPAAVRHLDGLQDPAIGEDGDLHAARILQGVDIDIYTVGCRAEALAGDARTRRLAVPSDEVGA